jgi:hypothetical protein
MSPDRFNRYVSYEYAIANEVYGILETENIETNTEKNKDK